MWIVIDQNFIEIWFNIHAPQFNTQAIGCVVGSKYIDYS